MRAALASREAKEADSKTEHTTKLMTAPGKRERRKRAQCASRTRTRNRRWPRVETGEGRKEGPPLTWWWMNYGEVKVHITKKGAA